MLTFEEVVVAYFDCRKRKRLTTHATEFEFELEKNLYDLYQDLLSNQYEIGESIAFVVDQPKVREIWAASFRDRIVHHVIYNRLKERFYSGFIRNNFACIPLRGSMDASDSLWSGMRSITKNWKEEDHYYLGGDVRNFFVSIHKPILFSLLEKKIQVPWQLDLTKKIVFHDPRKKCFMKSDKRAFARVPAYKSLWHSDDDSGLPIGNLTSQFFANVYLNELDQFVKHKLKAKYYYRYVDDFIILHESSEVLNDYFKKIELFLQEKLKLELHPFKKRLGKINQGIDFVGYFHKPYHRYTRKRTVNRLKSKITQWKHSPHPYDEDSLIKIRDSVNSYYGLMRPTSSFKLRKKLSEQMACSLILPDAKYQKMVLLKSLKS